MIANGHDLLAGPFTRQERYRLVSRKACERINFVEEKNDETQAAIEKQIARSLQPHPMEKHTVGSGYLQERLLWAQTEGRALLALMAYHATEKLRVPVVFPAVLLLLMATMASAQTMPPTPPGYKAPVTSPKGAETFAMKPMVLTLPPPSTTNLYSLGPIKWRQTKELGRIPIMSLTFKTNVARATVYSGTNVTDWRCATVVSNLVAGQPREVGYCCDSNPVRLFVKVTIP